MNLTLRSIIVNQIRLIIFNFDYRVSRIWHPLNFRQPLSISSASIDRRGAPSCQTPYESRPLVRLQYRRITFSAASSAVSPDTGLEL